MSLYNFLESSGKWESWKSEPSKSEDEGEMESDGGGRCRKRAVGEGGREGRREKGREGNLRERKGKEREGGGRGKKKQVEGKLLS